ncbi:MAG: sensor histidine kinase, partial [Ruminococcaceae bacterium]|nr:sensor histidine kinase [Oscillospiraceae bacterium]
MKKEDTTKKILGTVSNFFIFFLLAAFVTTCCIMLFITALQSSIGRMFTKEEITVAAKITMLNVILLSIGMALIDYVRRKFTVERPVKRITDATSKMIEGDFSVRIEPISKFANDDSFNEIIECINKMATELSGVETLRTDFVA